MDWEALEVDWGEPDVEWEEPDVDRVDFTIEPADLVAVWFSFESKEICSDSAGTWFESAVVCMEIVGDSFERDSFDPVMDRIDSAMDRALELLVASALADPVSSAGIAPWFPDVDFTETDPLVTKIFSTSPNSGSPVTVACRIRLSV